MGAVLAGRLLADHSYKYGDEKSRKFSESRASAPPSQLVVDIEAAPTRVRASLTQPTCPFAANTRVESHWTLRGQTDVIVLCICGRLAASTALSLCFFLLLSCVMFAILSACFNFVRLNLSLTEPSVKQYTSLAFIPKLIGGGRSSEPIHRRRKSRGILKKERP